MKHFISLSNYWVDFVLITVFFGTFYYMFREIPHIDLKDHLSLLQDYLDNNYFPIPPGYYGLIYALDLIIRVKYPFVASAVILLTFLMYFKYRATLDWIRTYFRNDYSSSFIFAISISLLFLSPIYVPFIDKDYWYLGKFTPTIWHNSTLICVFPFCILLVKKTLEWLKENDKKRMLLMFFYAFIILLIKPSFLFCFIPAFPIYALLVTRRINKEVIIASSFSLVIFAFILLEKFLIFTWDPMINILYEDEQRSQIVLWPLHVWLKFAREPIFDFLSSFPLLIGYLFFWRKSAFQSSFFNFSLCLLSFAVLIYFILGETGFREYHGNFYWQIPIALYLNNLSILMVALKKYLNDNRKMDLALCTVSTVFIIQFLLGLGYWARIFVFGNLS